MIFIVYSSDDEVIITTPDDEPKTIVDYFDNGGREKDDYDREVVNSSALNIRNRLVCGD
jgi:hypothetical protein